MWKDIDKKKKTKGLKRDIYYFVIIYFQHLKYYFKVMKQKIFSFPTQKRIIIIVFFCLANSGTFYSLQSRNTIFYTIWNNDLNVVVSFGFKCRTLGSNCFVLRIRLLSCGHLFYCDKKPSLLSCRHQSIMSIPSGKCTFRYTICHFYSFNQQ